MIHTLVIVYTLLHAYMYITAEIHLDERAFASCSFHDMTLQKFRRFYFSFFCYKKTGNSFMWVDMMTWQCWKFLLGWKVKSNKSVYSDIRLCFFFINKIVFCVMGKKKGTDDSLKKWTRDKLRCIYILQQGGGFPGAGSGLASWLWEEWLSSLENFKQLKIDKIPFHTLSFYKSRLITFVSLRPVAATVYLRANIKGSLCPHEAMRAAKHVSVCECEEWEDGKGFYLGATQLQITHQITPIMIKAKQRGFTTPHPTPCSLGTLSTAPSSTSTSRVGERG